MIMLRNIMECKYEFCSPEWDDITEQPKDLIRKLLVSDPKKRLTAKECLQHEFFQISKTVYVKFNARHTFQLAILAVRAMIRIKRLRFTPEPLSIDIAKEDPYRLKTLRKAIDGCAFKGNLNFILIDFVNFILTFFYQFYIHLFLSILYLPFFFYFSSLTVYNHWVKRGEVQNRALIFSDRIRSIS